MVGWSSLYDLIGSDGFDWRWRLDWKGSFKKVDVAKERDRGPRSSFPTSLGYS